jgi:hypothetical protein
MNNPNLCGHHTAGESGHPWGPAGKGNYNSCPGKQAEAVRSIQATVDIECQGSFSTVCPRSRIASAWSALHFMHVRLAW